MCIRILILGRPGSGKSTAARYLCERLAEHSWIPYHVDDYPVLQAMFQADTAHTQFRPTKRGGFDATDLTVLDTALLDVERQVQTRLSEQINAVTIEFARCDYRTSLSLFEASFLENAYILYLDSAIDVCLERVHQRLAHPICPDDHPSCSDELLLRHYYQDNRPYFISLQRDAAVEYVHVIDNNGDLPEFLAQIDCFAGEVIKRETPVERPGCLLGI